MCATTVIDRADIGAIGQMDYNIDYGELNEALTRCGSTWDIAQAHGMLCSRLAVAGTGAGAAWQQQVLQGTSADSASCQECAGLLEALGDFSYQQLAERQSTFVLLLPDDTEPADVRAEALAHWCEGFLHGLVSVQADDRLRQRLAADPLVDVIKDLLQITRAMADADDDKETNEAAYTELVEYVRVAAQLTYEELADLRPGANRGDKDETVLH